MRKRKLHAKTSESIKNSLQRNDIQEFFRSHCDLQHHIMCDFKLRKVKPWDIKKNEAEKRILCIFINYPNKHFLSSD